MFACYEKKKKELFMKLIESKPFPPAPYCLCQKAETFYA